MTDITRVERDEDSVYVTTRYSLWAALPPEVRATPADIERYRARKTATPQSARDREAARFTAALATAGLDCLVAISRPELSDRYLPCSQPVVPGEDLCRRHGGPSVAPRVEPASLTVAKLTAEVARLRAALAAADDAEKAKALSLLPTDSEGPSAVEAVGA